MQVKSGNGFDILTHRRCGIGDDRLASMSSFIENPQEKPSSSFLWISNNHHLNREEVREFIGYLQNWLDTGRLEK